MLNDTVIVVTGLTRSGTTCMMRQLEAGGIPVFYDDDKPFETKEEGKTLINYGVMLRETHWAEELAMGDSSWLPMCKGKAVKLLSPAKGFIPKGFKYLFIYMDRKVNSIVRSNQKYLERTTQEIWPITPALIDQVNMDRKKGMALLKTYPDSQMMVVKFEKMMKNPKLIALRVERFMGVTLDKHAMVDVVVKRPTRCLNGMLEEQIYSN